MNAVLYFVVYEFKAYLFINSQYISLNKSIVVLYNIKNNYDLYRFEYDNYDCEWFNSLIKVFIDFNFSLLHSRWSSVVVISHSEKFVNLRYSIAYFYSVNYIVNAVCITNS